MKPSGPGLLFVGRFLIAASISVFVIGPFIFSISPYVSDSKESACNVGDPGSIPGSERSLGEGNGNLLLYSYLGKSMDRGYSPWDHKESDITE